MTIDSNLTQDGWNVTPIPSPALKLSDVAPNAENLTAVAGAALLATRSDHRHPRITSATTDHTLDINGECTVVFTRTFQGKPSITFTLEEGSDLGPIQFKVKSWTTDGGGNYTGCVVKGYRGRLLPATLALLSALISYDVFAGVTTGALFSCIALQRSAA